MMENKNTFPWRATCFMTVIIYTTRDGARWMFPLYYMSKIETVEEMTGRVITLVTNQFTAWCIQRCTMRYPFTYYMDPQRVTMLPRF